MDSTSSKFIRTHRRHRSHTEINPLAAINAASASEPRRRAHSVSLSGNEAIHAAELRAFNFPRTPSLVEPCITSIVSTPPQLAVVAVDAVAVAAPLSSFLSSFSIGEGTLTPPAPSVKPSVYEHMLVEREVRPPSPCASRRMLPLPPSVVREQKTKGMLQRIETGRRRRFVLKAVLPEYHQKWLESLAQQHGMVMHRPCGFGDLSDYQPLLSPSLIA